MKRYMLLTQFQVKKIASALNIFEIFLLNTLECVINNYSATTVLYVFIFDAFVHNSH